MHKLILSLLFFISLNSYSQSDYFTITGKVTTADTKLPMNRATVFAENTTFATATDSNGNFKLYLPKGGYNIAVSFTGYVTQNTRVSYTDNKELIFELPVKEKTMEEVAIVSTGEVKNGWEKYGQKFLEEFIGKSPNSKNCIIRNPEKIKFFFSKRKNRLKVLAAEPIIVDNQSLGYKLTYELDSFVYEFNTDVSIYTGFPRFDEMMDSTGLMKVKWDSARLDTYHGSVMHFMRSCYHQKFDEDGFEIGFPNKWNDRDTLIKSQKIWTDLKYEKDSIGLVSIQPVQSQLGIIYTPEGPYLEYLKENNEQPADLQLSVIVFSGDHRIFIEKNGYYYDQNDLIFNYYWSWEKVADALPFNYNPPQ